MVEEQPLDTRRRLQDPAACGTHKRLSFKYNEHHMPYHLTTRRTMTLEDPTARNHQIPRRENAQTSTQQPSPRKHPPITYSVGQPRIPLSLWPMAQFPHNTTIQYVLMLMVQIEQEHSLASSRHSRYRADHRPGCRQLFQPTFHRQLPDRKGHCHRCAKLKSGRRVGGCEAEGGRQDFAPIA